MKPARFHVSSFKFQELCTNSSQNSTSCASVWQPPGGYFDLEGLKTELAALERRMEQPDFWHQQQHAKEIAQRAENLRQELASWEGLTHAVEQLHELTLAAQREDEVSLVPDLHADLATLTKQFRTLELLVLLWGRYDQYNAMVSIHAGTGGVEAQDWAAMLLRMYLRYAEAQGFTVTVMDETRGAEAGLKNVSLQVAGRYAYGYLKSEAGVHRLVRISPFDAEKMRHTSFALVEVVPELPETDAVELKEADLKIETIRSSGPGGQSVNTTDSAVRVTHLPTGIVVKCQNERSQLQNRTLALRYLQAKLTARQLEKQEREISSLRGGTVGTQWGSQIRSYVLQPYKLVKDHRTGFESTEPASVLDGDLDDFIESYLRYKVRAGSKK